MGERHAQDTGKRRTGGREEEEEMDEGDKEEDTRLRKYTTRRPHRWEAYDARRRQRMPCGNSRCVENSVGAYNINIVDAKTDAAAAAAEPTAAAVAPSIQKTFQNHVQKAWFDTKRRYEEATALRPYRTGASER